MNASAAATRRGPLGLRPKYVAVFLVLGLAVAAAAIFLWPPGLTSTAGACEEVTSSACQPFVDVLYSRADVRSDEIRSIDGLPHCGAALCRQTFGGDLVRLKITYYDGSTAEFSCYQMILGDTSCQPVADSG